MPYPAPSIETLFEQFASYLETGLVRRAQEKGLAVSSEAIARAVRSPRGVLGAIAKANAASSWSEHQGLAWAARQVIADTAEPEGLEDLAGHYGIVRRPATRAIGRVLLAGDAGLAIPVGLELRTPTGAVLALTEGGSLDAQGAGAFEARALVAGREGNVAGGAVLPLITTLPGLTAQAATVDPAGVAGGAGIETHDALLERYLVRKRQPPMGGAERDYPAWVQNDFAAAHVAVRPGYAGAGTVGVVVAMGTRAAPRAPTPAEAAAIARHIGQVNGPQGVRPVTADAMVLAAELRTLPLTLEVEPDTPGVRAAVEQAFAAFVAREAAIGAPVAFSRLSEAISSAVGEYRHVLMAPARDVPMGPLELPVPGPITWVAP